YEIIDRPPSGTRKLSRQWLRQVGAEEVFEPQELVANGNLPIRPRRLDIPICKIVGINPEVSNVKFNRPDFQKTLGFPHEQAEVAFRPLRAVPADIEDMPSFDQGQRPSLMSLSRVPLPSV